MKDCGRYTEEWKNLEEEAEKECIDQGKKKMEEANAMSGKLKQNLMSLHKSQVKNLLQKSMKETSLKLSCWEKMKSFTIGKKSWGSQFYFWLVFFLEFTSCLDLIGDSMVLFELF